MRLTPLRTLAVIVALSVPAGLLIAQETPVPSPVEDQAPPDEPAPSGEQPEPTPEENAAAPRDPLEIYADLNLFGEIFDRIRAEYVDPPDEQELIFQRFSRGRQGRRSSEGAGLGLAIVKMITEAHDGSVAVTSTPGQGSTFSLLLPVSGPGESQ